LFVVVLPLTLVLIIVAIGATTLHQNEMRNLVAAHDQRAAREAATGLDERASHQLASLRSIAEAVALGLSPADELRSSDRLLADFEGGVVVIGANGVVLTSLPQPPDQKLLSAVKNVSPTAAGLSLTSPGDILAVARSTDNTITVAGLFSAQALRLPTLANTLRSSPRTRVIVVDTGARIVYHSGGASVSSDASSEPGATEALRGESGATFVTDDHQIEWVVAFEPVPSVGWGLIIAEPWEDVVNPLLRTSLLTPLVLVPAFVIAQNDRMVAINSAIEVDLTGQVCADSIGPRFYSGVGGQVDFIYGASRSNGGIPIIALPAMTLIKGQAASKIVSMLKQGAGVVTSRNHVHYIVTEFGVADLYGKTIRQRAKALIDIAHPDFRAELTKQAHELKYL
jgi:hypothetical protein